jgi:O-antigen/teichoic acid export membrane protein
MAFAMMGGGVFNLLASLLVFKMPGAQVNAFDTALAGLAILGTPALGLQAAFAAQAAVADDEAHLKSLAAMMRWALIWLGAGWALLAGVSLIFSGRILTLYNLNEPAFLWIFLALVLLTLWTPVATGVLQGRQDFLWFGTYSLLAGAGRFTALAIGVAVFKFGALGGLLGVLTGALVSFLLAAWRIAGVLTKKGVSAEWQGFLKKAFLLTLGLGALVTVMQADALIVREKIQSSLTTGEAVGYTAARRIGQVLVFLVGAVVSVMYPKVARSLRHSGTNDALRLTVGLTAAISLIGALTTSMVPGIPLRILAGAYASDESARLVVAYVWALVPLAISNVLVWNLMARECYRVVPILVAVAAGCWFALRAYCDRLLTVVAVVGAFYTLLLVVSAIFTLLDLRRDKPVAAPVNA